MLLNTGLPQAIWGSRSFRVQVLLLIVSRDWVKDLGLASTNDGGRRVLAPETLSTLSNHPYKYCLLIQIMCLLGKCTLDTRALTASPPSNPLPPVGPSWGNDLGSRLFKTGGQSFSLKVCQSLSVAKMGQPNFYGSLFFLLLWLHCFLLWNKIKIWSSIIWTVMTKIAPRGQGLPYLRRTL